MDGRQSSRDFINFKNKIKMLPKTFVPYLPTSCSSTYLPLFPYLPIIFFNLPSSPPSLSLSPKPHFAFVHCFGFRVDANIARHLKPSQKSLGDPFITKLHLHHHLICFRWVSHLQHIVMFLFWIIFLLLVSLVVLLYKPFFYKTFKASPFFLFLKTIQNAKRAHSQHCQTPPINFSFFLQVSSSCSPLCFLLFCCCCC